MMRRYLRQMRLFEVGAQGQAKFAATAVRLVGEGVALETCAAYLNAAGVGRVALSAAPEAQVPVDPDNRASYTLLDLVEVSVPQPLLAATAGDVTPTATPCDPAAAEFYAGAIAALEVLRGALARQD